MQASWNPLTDLQLLFQYHFMHNAFLAGTIVAVVAGAVGYYMVLRAQTFAGHALAHVGFAGAAGALLFGLSPVVGLLVVGIGAAVGMGMLGDRNGSGDAADGVAIAAVFTFAIGIGLLFLQLYPGQAENAYSILFGAVLGITDTDVETIAAAGIATLIALTVMARPLLFASLDPEVAMARGIPVRALSIGFLVLLAFAVAQSVQVVGILLIFALLVTPAATAQRLASRPPVAIALSIALALLFTWLGIAVAYFAPYSVVGFYVTTIAFLTYAVVVLLTSERVERAWQSRAHARSAAA
ncbi:MAG TPA: metal ABC transporter permease [Chloroflexi bacterium]|jgi:zinc/manganese transport system permease protein|nr:metal ABC transporter permease [Chloroflexota bacterium]